MTLPDYWLSLIRLPTLRSLDAGVIHTDEMMKQLGERATQLTRLDICARSSMNNKSSSTFFLSIAQLSCWCHVYVDIPQRSIEHLTRMVNLRWLKLQYISNIGDKAAQVIGQSFPKLNHLELEECSITPAAMTSMVRQLGQLRSLRIDPQPYYQSENGIWDTIFARDGVFEWRAWVRNKYQTCPPQPRW
jgi:hypothetical protein